MLMGKKNRKEHTNGTLFVNQYSIHSHLIALENVKFQQILKDILEYKKSTRNMGRARMEEEQSEQKNVQWLMRKRHVSIFLLRPVRHGECPQYQYRGGSEGERIRQFNRRGDTHRVCINYKVLLMSADVCY